jgi:3-oxoadipate enol-lactonase
MKKFISISAVFLIILCLTACETSRKTNSESTSASETTESVTQSIVKTATKGDLEMKYIKFGTGEKNFVIIPGLSIHSVMGSAAAIEEAYSSFANDYTVYVFDRAENIKEGYSIRDMATDTATAMKELNIDNAYIFGASQGGMIAQYIAIDYPELVNKLILGSTLSKPNDTAKTVVNKWISLAENRDENALLESFVNEVYSPATVDAYGESVIEANKGITEEEYERFIILAKACENFNSYDELSKIQCPVLVIGCEGDKVLTAEGSKEIADKLGCEIYLYDSTYGHGVYDEASDYKDKCLEFFEK